MVNVGWVGVGSMGRPMVARVAEAGNPVKAYDVSASRCDGLADLGIEVATSARAAAEDAEVLVLMTATPGQCAAVLFGEGGDGGADGTTGVMSVLARGATVVVMATVGPAAVEAWAARLADHGLATVDAPVSGGTARAARGELLTMVGAAPAALSAARPVLDAVSAKVVVAGSTVGDGQRMKLVNQLLCGVHIAVAAEALGFAEALGLDAGAALDVVSEGAAASFMLKDRGERMVSGAFDEVHSALDIFVKDMGLVTGAAREATYPAPLAAAAEQLYLAGRRAGLGGLDDSSIVELARGANARSGAHASSGGNVRS